MKVRVTSSIKSIWSSSSTSCLFSAGLFTLVLCGERGWFFFSFLNDIPVMLIRLTLNRLNRVEHSANALSFFCMFSYPNTPFRAAQYQKRVQSLHGNQIHPLSNVPYPLRIFAMHYAPISLGTTMVLRKHFKIHAIVAYMSSFRFFLLVCHHRCTTFPFFFFNKLKFCCST